MHKLSNRLLAGMIAFVSAAAGFPGAANRIAAETMISGSSIENALPDSITVLKGGSLRGTLGLNYKSNLLHAVRFGQPADLLIPAQQQIDTDDIYGLSYSYNHKLGGEEVWLGEDSVIYGNAFFNNSYAFLQTPKKGISILGDLSLMNNSLRVYSLISRETVVGGYWSKKTTVSKETPVWFPPLPQTPEWSPNESAYALANRPYFYVQGKLEDPAHGIGECAMNLFAGSVRLTDVARMNLYGDLCLYEALGDSFIDLRDKSFHGNLCCNNSMLELSGSFSSYGLYDSYEKNYHIDGNFCMTNPNGKLIISKSIRVGGAFVCKGELILQNGAEIYAEKGIYLDPNKVTGSEGVLFNGEKIGQCSDFLNNQGDRSVFLDLNEQTAEQYPNLREKGFSVAVSADSYDELFAAIPDGYALFPDYAQPQALFDSYIRPDCAGMTPDECKEMLMNHPEIAMLGDAFTDLEKWEYMPVTLPSENADEMQQMLIPFKKCDGFVKTGFDVSHREEQIESFNQYLHSMFPEQPEQDLYMPDDTFLYGDEYYGYVTYPDPSMNRTQQVTFLSHDADGKLAETTLENAYVVTESCTLDLQKIGSNATIYIDPYFNATQPGRDAAYNSSHPMTVDIITANGTDYNTILVNNTTFYPEHDMTAGQILLSDAGMTPGKRDVVIRITGENGDVQFDHSAIMMTGAYEQYQQKTMNVIENPVYPCTEFWSALPECDRYCFELVPNTVLIGKSGCTYSYTNGTFFNVNMYLPDSVLRVSVTNGGIAEFRTNVDSIPMNVEAPCLIGTMCVKTLEDTNYNGFMNLKDRYRGARTLDEYLEPEKIGQRPQEQCGDVNKDGTINLKDAVMIRRYIAGGWNVDIDIAGADVNRDGVVNLKDVVLIRRYIAGGWGVKLNGS